MIDLDAWLREQRRLNLIAAYKAMCRLSEKYDWDPPEHPNKVAMRRVAKAGTEMADNLRRTMRLFAEWFLPRYHALERAFSTPPRSYDGTHDGTTKQTG